MRDDYRRSADRKSFERFLYLHFGYVIERGSRLVEYKHGRIFQKRPCDSHSLPLSARKFDSPFADVRIVAVVERFDKFVDIRVFSRFLYLLVGGVKVAVGDIFFYRSAENEHVLRYYADIATKIVQTHILYIHAVDGDFTRIYIVKSRDKIAKRSLAAARRSDQRNGLTRLYIERQIIEYKVRFVVGFFFVSATHVVEFYIAFERSDFDGLRAVFFGFYFHYFEEASETRHTLLYLLENSDKRPDGRDKHRDVQHVRRKFGSGHHIVTEKQTAR